MKWLIDTIKIYLCRHEYVFVRNIYGDEIIHTGRFKRSWWKCKKCGVFESRPNLHHGENL